MAEASSSSASELVHPTTARPTLQLHNQDANSVLNAQELNGHIHQKRPLNDIRTFMIWSIFNLLFVPFGIVCCYFSRKVSQFKMQNRYEKAKKWSKRTFVLNSITTILMAGVIITSVMLTRDYVQQNPNRPANRNRTTAAYIPWQPGR